MHKKPKNHFKPIQLFMEMENLIITVGISPILQLDISF